MSFRCWSRSNLISPLLEFLAQREFSDNDQMKIEAGEYVIVILHTPREKLFGILDEINSAGVSLRGIDLGYFEDWCRAIAAGEPHLPMSDYFLPMWRIERITRDEGNADIQSMAEQFEQRTGKSPAMF